MGKSSPSPPPAPTIVQAPAAPDTAALSAAQAQANVDAARLSGKMSKVDVYSPQGSAVFQPIGDDRYQQVITLTPAAQRAYESQLGVTDALYNLAGNQVGRVQSAVNAPWDLSRLPALVSGIDRSRLPDQITGIDLSQLPPAPTADQETRQRVEAALMSRLDPQFERDRASLETQLANQGIALGSEAYTQGVDELRRSQNDARMQAVLAGGQEMANQFGMASQARSQAAGEALTNANLGNAARATDFNELMALAAFQNQSRQTAEQEMAYARNLPLNETAALLGTGRIDMPQFQQAAPVSVQAPNIEGTALQGYGIASQNVANQNMAASANYQSQLSAYNAQRSRNSQLLGSLFGLAGSAIGGWASSGFA